MVQTKLWCEVSVKKLQSAVVKTKLSCVTPLKNCSLTMWKQNFFARDFLEKQQVGDVKTKLSCETSLKHCKLKFFAVSVFRGDSSLQWSLFAVTVLILCSDRSLQSLFFAVTVLCSDCCLSVRRKYRWTSFDEIDGAWVRLAQTQIRRGNFWSTKAYSTKAY